MASAYTQQNANNGSIQFSFLSDSRYYTIFDTGCKTEGKISVQKILFCGITKILFSGEERNVPFESGQLKAD